MKLESESSFLADAHVESFWRRTMTALIVVCTSGGGVVKALISAMYFLSNLSMAAYAEIRAGSHFLSSAATSAAYCIVSSLSLLILTVYSSMFSC